MIWTMYNMYTTRISCELQIERLNLQEVDYELIVEVSPNRWENAIWTVDEVSINTDRSKEEDVAVGGSYYLLQGKLGLRFFFFFFLIISYMWPRL